MGTSAKCDWGALGGMVVVRRIVWLLSIAICAACVIVLLGMDEAEKVAESKLAHGAAALVEEDDNQSLMRALQPKENRHGAAVKSLPITGWTDSLDGLMDTKALCAHIETEIQVERERFKSNTKRHLEAHYGAGRVTHMEAQLRATKARALQQLQRGGCHYAA